MSKEFSLSAIGQDSHRFVKEGVEKALILGGFEVKDHRGLAGNSDADVLLHSLTNAISGITCIPILGGVADKLCLKHGITDSAEYLKLALADLADAGYELVHVSFTVQAKTPKFFPIIKEIRQSVAKIIDIPVDHIMLTATSGEELTQVGQGEGIEAFCIITVVPLTDEV